MHEGFYKNLTKSILYLICFPFIDIENVPGA